MHNLTNLAKFFGRNLSSDERRRTMDEGFRRSVDNKKLKSVPVRAFTGTFNQGNNKRRRSPDENQEKASFDAESTQFSLPLRKRIKEEGEGRRGLLEDDVLGVELDVQPMEGDIPERKKSPASLPIGAENGAEGSSDPKVRSVKPKIRRSSVDGDENIEPESEHLVTSTDGQRRKSSRPTLAVDYTSQMYLAANRVKPMSRRSVIKQEISKQPVKRPVVGRKSATSRRSEVKTLEETQHSDFQYTSYQDEKGKTRVAEYDMSKGRVSKEEVTVMDESQFEELKERFMKKSKSRSTAVVGKADPEEEVEEKTESEADSQEAEPSENVEPIYEVERIIRKIRNPTSDKDKVFIVMWKGWNVSACTIISLDDLKGSPDMMRLYVDYEKTVSKVCLSYRKKGPPAHKQPLKLISNMHKKRWLTDEQWETETRKKEYKKKYGLWAWIELSRTWNRIDRESNPDAEHFPLYLETFHEDAKLPSNFEYISRNTISDDAKRILGTIVIEPREGCSCSCRGPCDLCQTEMNEHEPCRLKNNALHIFQEEGMMSRSFETLVCNGACSRTDGEMCCLPRRQCPLLVAWRPKVDGVGVYATETIPKFNVLCEYAGEMISKQEADDRGNTNYQFSVPGVDIVIDAIKKGNEARFINHSCEPNCGLLVLHDGSLSAVPRLFIVTLRDIKQGEELLLDYHPSYANMDNDKNPPPPNASKCFCEAKKCRRFV